MGATGAVAVAQLAGGFAESVAIREEGAFRREQFETNARMNERKAKGAIKRGDKEAAKHGKRIKSLVGKQRANLAGQGVLVSEGVAAEIQDQTLEIGREEARTIRNNAWREAFGYRSQALADRTSGAAVSSAANFNATTTLLSSGLNSLSFFAQQSGAFDKKLENREESSSKLTGPVEGSVMFDPANYEGIA